MTETVEEAALGYLKQHWSVIPILTRDKRPAIRWMEFQHRRAGRKEVKEWYKRWPESNVGIVTGVISGLVVLDIDPEHDGEITISRLIREHGPLPNTIEAVSGGGGRHVYFSHPGGVVRNKVGLAPGIDLRGDGGCIVAPPSLHASGNTYLWLAGHDPQHAHLAPMPDWLLRKATGSRNHTLNFWRNLVKEGIPKGERNTTIASLTGHLLWHGVDTEVAQELLLCWNRVRCHPPLPDQEVICAVLSIARLHEHQSD